MITVKRVLLTCWVFVQLARPTSGPKSNDSEALKIWLDATFELNWVVNQYDYGRGGGGGGGGGGRMRERMLCLGVFAVNLKIGIYQSIAAGVKLQNSMNTLSWQHQYSATILFFWCWRGPMCFILCIAMQFSTSPYSFYKVQEGHWVYISIVHIDTNWSWYKSVHIDLY